MANKKSIQGVFKVEHSDENQKALNCIGDFVKYEIARRSGKYNMITQINEVSEITGIPVKRIAKIQANYGNLRKTYITLLSIAEGLE